MSTNKTMKFLADALHGRGGFADGSYLIKYPREGDKKYERRKEIAWYSNPMSQACNRFVGFIKKRPVTRDISGEFLEQFAKDCSWRGDSIGGFWSRFMMEAKARGGMVLLVEMPKKLPKDKASQVKERAFPYLVPINPEDIEDYRLDERGQLAMLEMPGEDKNGKPVIRGWDDQRWYIKREGKKIDGGDHGLGRCPAIAFSETGKFMEPGQFAPIAHLSKRLYNMQSELDELLRSQTFSLLTYPVDPQELSNFVQGDDVKAVAETIGTENMIVHGAGAQPGFLSPDATPTEAYYKAIDMIMRRIDEVSLNVQPPQQQESGIAMQLRFQLLNASLSSFAARMQDFENLMWDIVIAWLKSSGTASSTWATDYSLADMQTEISTLQQMQMAGAPDSYIKEKMKQLVSLDLGSSNQELISQINSEIDEMEHDDDHSQF